jgi:hypothetical protein
MKMKLTAATVLCLTTWLTTDCTKQEATLKPGTYNDLSSFAKNFIGLNSSANAALAPSRNGAMNKSFQGTMNSFAGTIGVANAGSDSSIVSDPYQTCAKTIQSDNADGSITVVTDYGTGCTQTYGDWQSIQWGKSSYTYKNSYTQQGSVYTSQYYFRSISDNLGGKTIYQGDTSTWLSNGRSTSSGISTYDTAKNTFSGSNTFSDTSEFAYNKQVYSYRGQGKYSYSNQRSVQEASSYRYSDGKNYYESTVTVPIVTDYTCNTNKESGGGVIGIFYMQVPVSGHEIVKYSQDGVEGEFELDYGDGTCDSLITIIENGKVIVIDMKTMPIAPMRG